MVRKSFMGRRREHIRRCGGEGIKLRLFMCIGVFVGGVAFLTLLEWISTLFVY